VVLLLVKKKPQQTIPHHHVITFKPVLGNQKKLRFGMEPYFNLTRTNMEDNLNILKNGR
jgi:hypothetical protein